MALFNTVPTNRVTDSITLIEDVAAHPCDPYSVQDKVSLDSSGSKYMKLAQPAHRLLPNKL